MRFGSLFSGIGGFDLGFEQAGHECAWQVEIDPACQRVLRSRFQREPAGRGAANGHLTAVDDGRGQAGAGVSGGPDRGNPERGQVRASGQPERGCGPLHTNRSTLHADVTTVGRHNLDPVDLVCGGFPCQDLSVAGKRAGLDGDRSGLWFEFHRILAELRPRWVVIENVPGLLSSNEGADMAVVLGGLGELGYGWAFRVLDAQHFGVAQRRRRVFIVGHLGEPWSAAPEVLFEPESCGGYPPARRQAGEGVAGTLGGSSGGRGWQDTERMTFLPTVSPAISGPNDPQAADQAAYVTVGVLTASQDNGSTGDAHVESGQIIVASIQDGRDIDKAQNGLGISTDGIAYTLDAAATQAVALSNRGIATEVTETLRSHPRPGSNTVGALAIRVGGDFGDPTINVDDKAFLAANHMSDRQMAVHDGVSAAVRRLTPTECERLQGFPDGWTAGQSDSTRYRQLGNAVAVPVAAWIGRRLMESS